MGINAVVIVMKMINRLVILLGGDAVIGGSALECLLMDVRTLSAKIVLILTPVAQLLSVFG